MRIYFRRKASRVEELSDQENAEEEKRPRSTGSMVQNPHDDITTRIKNFEWLEMGQYRLQPWYFSPYPAKLAAMGKIYLCEFCLSFMKCKTSLKRHLTKCGMRCPPGNEIYRFVCFAAFQLGNCSETKIQKRKIEEFAFSNLMEENRKHTLRTCVCWQSVFSTTKRSTTIQIRSFST